MKLEDFLPKYPSIEDSVINPYKGQDFNEAIYKKKEFYDNKLEEYEDIPTEAGILLKHQQTIAKYMSSNTPYSGVLLLHEMGSGKCVHPDTIVYFSESPDKPRKKITINDLHREYKQYKRMDRDGGEWSTPRTKLYTSSIDDEKNQITGEIISLYRQRVSEQLVRVVFTDESSLLITKNHKILTEKGWSSIHNGLLGISGMAYKENGDCIRIVSMFPVYYNGFVFDLEVDKYHNYIANGIITHNTCSAIGAIEQIKRERGSINKAVVITKGDRSSANFQRDLMFTCTMKEYIPDNYEELEGRKKTIRVKKKISTFYTFKTYKAFSNELENMPDDDIIKNFSNCIFVIDEIHNVRIQDKVSVYEQFHKLLHLAKNTKTVLLSGTPMVDSPAEIASIMNLILPLDKQLPTEDAFMAEYMSGSKLSERGKDKLYEAVKGRVSFLRSLQSDVKKNFVGHVIGQLKLLVVNDLKMSEFQTEHYKRAWEQEKQAVYADPSDASLFVYPDGSWGATGYAKYMGDVSKKSKVKPIDEFIKGEDVATTLKNIKKYSVSYYNTIKYILKNPKKLGFCFITAVHGSGSKLFAHLLELCGFIKAGKSPGKNEVKRRYILVTEETSSNELSRNLAVFNSPDNIDGDYIQLIIGGDIVKEGFTFKNIQFEFILTPDFNYTGVSQALARGIRLNSHRDLIARLARDMPDKGPSLARDIKVDIFQNVSIPRDNTPSIDLKKYEVSEMKDMQINSIVRLLMTSSFDCALNYRRNLITNKMYDNTRECNYTQCNYDCRGIDNNYLATELKKDELDYSTYQLYYSNEKITEIYNKIIKIIQKYTIVTTDTIVSELKDVYSEDDVKVALGNIVDYDASGYIYESSLKLKKSNLQQIISSIQDIFKHNFSLNYGKIIKIINSPSKAGPGQSPGYTEYEILDALNTIIEENVIMRSKYGIKMVLREEDDVYFLSRQFDNTQKTDVFYADKITLDDSTTNEKLISSVCNKTRPLLVEKVINNASILSMLPLKTQEIILEECLSMYDEIEDKKMKENVDKIVDRYISYLAKDEEDNLISTLLEKSEPNNAIVCDKGVFERKKRCMNGETKVWTDCEKVINENIEEDIKGAEYGIIGKKNSIMDAFCLSQVDKMDDVDSRKINVGRVCKTIPKKDLALYVLKLKDLPFKKVASTNLKQDVLNINGDIPVDTLTEEDMMRILWWNRQTTRDICDGLEGYLNDRNLVFQDTQCGSPKKKKEGKEGKDAGSKEDGKDGKDKKKDIGAFNIYVYKDIDNKHDKKADLVKVKGEMIHGNKGTWTIAYKGKKPVVYFNIQNDTVMDVIFSPYYAKQKELMTIAIRKAVQDGAKVSIASKHKLKIKFLEEFGFIKESDDNNTVKMIYRK